MYVVQTATTTSAPTLALATGDTRSVELCGVLSTYAESSTFYIKFWWQGNTNKTPVLGVTLPNLTVPISAGAPGFMVGRVPGIVMQGPVYWAATANAVGTDSTALGAGGDIITLFLE